MSTLLSTLARRPVPPPVAAGIGLVAVGAEAARTLPGRALGLPITAYTAVHRLRETLKEEYAELALRGETALSSLRGTSDGVATVESVVDPFHLADAAAGNGTAATPTDLVTPGATLSHDELPLEDYDHLTIGSLRSRIRRLDAPALVQLRDYERAHANRLPVMVAFDNRLTTLAETAPDANQATLVTP